MRTSICAVIILSMTIVLGLAQTGRSEEAKTIRTLKVQKARTPRVMILKPKTPLKLVPLQPREVVVSEPVISGPFPIKRTKPIKARVKRAATVIRTVRHKEYVNLDEALRNADDVFQLNLSRQVFEYFPEEIFTLPNLEVLKLTGMELTEISPDIANLVNLKTLVLSHNQLEDLPYGIGDLSSLGWLDLSYNRLETIPDEIVNLSNLRFLKLSNNNISTLPAGIADLQNLRNLNLDGNPISKWEIAELAEALPECKIVF